MNSAKLTFTALELHVLRRTLEEVIGVVDGSDASMFATLHSLAITTGQLVPDVSATFDAWQLVCLDEAFVVAARERVPIMRGEQLTEDEHLALSHVKALVAAAAVD
jgi:hypothetical protein